MLIRFLQRGVTLIELMIGLAIVALVLFVAVPSFGIFLQNSQIRNAAGSVLDGLQPGNLARVHIAYEPVWAIGTGRNATPDDAAQVHTAIRGQLRGLGAPATELRILYGGSVKPDNAAALVAEPEIGEAPAGGARAGRQADEGVIAVPARHLAKRNAARRLHGKTHGRDQFVRLARGRQHPDLKFAGRDSAGAAARPQHDFTL